MTTGFFKSSELISKNINKGSAKTSKCGKCGLYKTCKSPRMPPTGSGEIRILHVAEAPGAREDEKNDQLVGQAGQLYRRVLRRLGIELDDCIKTNACICRPPKNKTPTTTQIKACRPNLMKTIKEYKPHIIIPLGSVALKSLIGHKFENDIGGINKWRGFLIPDREYKAWICPTFHPSYIGRETTPEVAEVIFKGDLNKAISLLDTPLPERTYEDLESKVQIIKHPKEITHWLEKLNISDVRLIAYDYEGSGLKPQHPDQSLRTCAISCGVDEVVAFPMVRSEDFKQQFRRFLANHDIKKIASNMKFEKDWSEVKVGGKANGFYFDPMLGMHVINNQPGICSLDFYNYALLGVEPYNAKVNKFLKSDDGRGNSLNHIDEIDLKSLLIYNGLDSLTELRDGLVMMDLIGIDYSEYYSGVTGKELAPQYFK